MNQPLLAISPTQDRVMVLDYVRDYVERIVGLMGVHGSAVHVVRHVLLVGVAVLAAWLAELF